MIDSLPQATLFDPAGREVVVTLCAPERHAIHKLMVVGERTGAFKAKAMTGLHRIFVTGHAQDTFVGIIYSSGWWDTCTGHRIE